MKIPEPIRFETGVGNLAERLAAVRKLVGAYTLNSAEASLHLSWSTNLECRLSRLLRLRDPGSSASPGALRDKVAFIDCWPCGSRLELHLLLYHLARHQYPQSYMKFLKLRLPWLLRLSAGAGFPRLEVTNRLATRPEFVLGPFAARSIAQDYEQSILGLFQIRRCVETLTPDPEHPGCIYGEMSQCLRPCQSAVSADEYRAETDRVREFLVTNGRAPLALLSSARERASEDMRFEEAAFMHKRIEKIKAAAAARPPVIAEVHSFTGIALTRALRTETFQLWPMFEGYWQNPVELDLSGGARSKSLDTELRELLMARLSEPHLKGDRGEALALFSRWYYSSWRDGEWFPFQRLSDLDYRRLVRAISKLAQEGKAPAM